MAKNKTKPDWLNERRGDIAIHHQGSDAGWVVEARWWGDETRSLSTGPLEVVIRLSEEATPNERAKGINAGVIRRAERLVAELTEEIHSSARGLASETAFRAELERRLKQLPTRGARSNTDAYYRELLSVVEDLEPTRASLIKDVADALDIPESTARSQIQRARKRRKDSEQ
jgi:hypothetical protein